MSSPSLEVHGELSAKPVTPWPTVLLTALLPAVIIGIIVLAFSWPTVTSEPKSIPLMVAGPQQQATQIEQSLEQAQPELFEIVRGDDRDAAVEALETREVYGAIVVGQPVEVLSASANNAATGQILNRVGQQLGQQTGAPVTQTDLIPFSPSDPNGAGLGVLSLPMVMGGLIGGILIGLQVIGGGRRIVAVLVYGAVAGLAVTALGGPVLDILQGPFGVTWLALSLSFTAMSATVAGLITLLRVPGIPIAALLFMFFANPISGTNSPKEFLPGPWGEIGQHLPPGAISTLVRDLSYFPEADTTRQWLVLAAWALLGVVLIVIGLASERRTVSRGRHAAHARRGPSEVSGASDAPGAQAASGTSGSSSSSRSTGDTRSSGAGASGAPAHRATAGTR